MTAINQIYITHCTYGSSALERRDGEMAARTLGYSARAGSLDGEALYAAYRQLVRRVYYHLPPDTPNTAILELTAHDAPRRLIYFPPQNGLQLLGQICYRQTDTEGRPGSYFAHLLFSSTSTDSSDGTESADAWSPLECLALWKAAGWTMEDPLEPRCELHPVESLDTLVHGRPAISDKVLASFLTTDPGGCFDDPGEAIPRRWREETVRGRQYLLVETLRAALPAADSQRHSLLLVVEPPLAALIWYGVFRLLPKGRLWRQLSFSTYEASTDRPSTRLAASWFHHEHKSTEVIENRPQTVVIDTRQWEGWPQDGGPSDYARMIVEEFVKGGNEALKARLDYLTDGGREACVEDLERLAAAHTRVPLILAGDDGQSDQAARQPGEPEIGPRDSSADDYLRRALREELARIPPGDLEKRLGPLARRPTHLLVLELAAGEPGTSEAVDYLLDQLPQDRVCEALAHANVRRALAERLGRLQDQDDWLQRLFGDRPDQEILLLAAAEPGLFPIVPYVLDRLSTDGMMEVLSEKEGSDAVVEWLCKMQRPQTHLERFVASAVHMEILTLAAGKPDAERAVEYLLARLPHDAMMEALGCPQVERALREWLCIRKAPEACVGQHVGHDAHLPLLFLVGKEPRAAWAATYLLDSLDRSQMADVIRSDQVDDQGKVRVLQRHVSRFGGLPPDCDWLWQIEGESPVPGLVAKLLAALSENDLGRLWAALSGREPMISFVIALREACRHNPARVAALSSHFTNVPEDFLVSVLSSGGEAFVSEYPGNEPILGRKLLEILQSLPDRPNDFLTLLPVLMAARTLLPPHPDDSDQQVRSGYNSHKSAIEGWDQCQKPIREIAEQLERGWKRLTSQKRLKALDDKFRVLAEAAWCALSCTTRSPAAKVACLREMGRAVLGGEDVLPRDAWYCDTLWEKAREYFEKRSWSKVPLAYRAPPNVRRTRMALIVITCTVAMGGGVLAVLSSNRASPLRHWSHTAEAPKTSRVPRTVHAPQPVPSAVATKPPVDKAPDVPPDIEAAAKPRSEQPSQTAKVAKPPEKPSSASPAPVASTKPASPPTVPAAVASPKPAHSPPVSSPVASPKPVPPVAGPVAPPVAMPKSQSKTTRMVSEDTAKSTSAEFRVYFDFTGRGTSAPRIPEWCLQRYSITWQIRSRADRSEKLTPFPLKERRSFGTLRMRPGSCAIRMQFFDKEPTGGLGETVASTPVYETDWYPTEGLLKVEAGKRYTFIITPAAGKLPKSK